MGVKYHGLKTNVNSHITGGPHLVSWISSRKMPRKTFGPILQVHQVPRLRLVRRPFGLGVIPHFFFVGCPQDGNTRPSKISVLFNGRCLLFLIPMFLVSSCFLLFQSFSATTFFIKSHSWFTGEVIRFDQRNPLKNRAPPPSDHPRCGVEPRQTEELKPIFVGFQPWRKNFMVYHIIDNKYEIYTPTIIYIIHMVYIMVS